jgi:hypothetical protein
MRPGLRLNIFGPKHCSLSDYDLSSPDFGRDATELDLNAIAAGATAASLAS